MKNKFLFCLSIFVTTILFDSCKDDSDKKPEITSKLCFISRISLENYGNVYEYDSLNRIKSYYNSQGNQGAFIYDYSITGKVWINNENFYRGNSELILNSQGAAISKRQEYFAATPDVDVVHITEFSNYFYDNKGCLIREIFNFISGIQEYYKDYTNEYTYEYTNGNMTYSKTKDQNGNETIWKYTYYEDKPNQLTDLQQKLDFKGKKNKNLIKTKEELKAGNSVISTYSYTFDTEGKLVTQTISIPGSKDLVNTYTWDCK